MGNNTRLKLYRKECSNEIKHIYRNLLMINSQNITNLNNSNELGLLVRYVRLLTLIEVQNKHVIFVSRINWLRNAFH